jgi:hypothetical protein
MLVLGLFSLGLLIGVALYFIDSSAFSTYVEEDGVVEWTTIAGLVSCAAINILRFFRLKKQKTKLFLSILLAASLALLFAVGEELSWGQRIFRFESGDFFNTYNTQKEVNLHNLQFGPVKLDKLIFSLLLSILICVYIFALPVLYRLLKIVKQWVDDLAIPVLQNYQLIAFGALIIAIGFIHDMRKWELLEMCSVLLLLVILLDPLNKQIYMRPQKTADGKVSE